MARSQSKSIRKLVSLSPELAERVEKFRESVGASSESDALKILIEDGLKMRDRREDLFERLKNATSKGQNLAEVINFLAADHPLVKSTTLDANELTIYLNTASDEDSQKFSYSRYQKEWQWLRNTGGFDDWEPIKPPPQRKRTSREELDDDIPF